MTLAGMNVSRETLDRLEHFARLFEKWARSINLVAPSTIGDLWRRHIEDSAQIYRLSPVPAVWADLGSGGGFPGVITAILLREVGDGWVHLFESNHKKASFLRVALAETDARGSVHPVRIEEAPSILPRCDKISARALADLDQLLAYSETWFARGETTAYFHKGREYRGEIEKARGRWDFDLVEHVSAVEMDSAILEICNVRRKNRS